MIGEINDKIKEIETGLKNTPLPNKIEIFNIPVWETAYNSYRMENNIIKPNIESGINIMQSKILNIKIGYGIAGFIIYTILKR